MVDFRKWFPALAVVALAFGAASTANADQVVSHPASFALKPPIIVAQMAKNSNAQTVASKNANEFINVGVNALHVKANIGDVAISNSDLRAYTSNAINTKIFGNNNAHNADTSATATITAPPGLTGNNDGNLDAKMINAPPVDPQGTNATLITRVVNVGTNAFEDHTATNNHAGTADHHNTASITASFAPA